MTITKAEPMGSELIISGQQSTFSAPQVAALAHMGVDQAPEGDLQVFFHVCQRTKLDPFARQIYMIGRPERALVNGEWRPVTKYTIQTGIDGFRLIARRAAHDSHDSLEYEDTLWCGPDGAWRDVWLGDSADLRAAKATVVRGGRRFSHVALFAEYAQTKRDGSLTSMWATKGANQLAKCAEAGALRKAFPQDLGGMYVDDEMDRVATDAAASSVVTGQRDFWADVDAAESEDALRTIWAEAARYKMLTNGLRQHITQRREKLTQPAEPEPEVVEAELIDAETGEVIEPAAQDDPDADRRRKMTTALLLGFKRLGIEDRPERLYWTAVIAGRRDGLTTTNDLSGAELREVLGRVERVKDRDALEALGAVLETEREGQGDGQG